MNAALATSMSAQVAPNDRVQLACIGCGARAHELMAGAMAHPQFEITQVVDAYTGRTDRALDRIKETRGNTAKIRRDYREVIADKSVDAIICATPDHWHKQIVVEAMKAGKDVYCEKPLTYKSAEGLEIIATAKETGRMLQVGSQGMSSMSQVRARQMIKEGKLGKVTMIRAAYNRNSASGAWIYPIPPDANPQTVNWDMFLGSAPKHGFDLERFFRWRCYRDYSGGIATDLFVHLCTTIHFLMDAKVPAKVMGMGGLYRWKESRDVPDTLNAVLEYPEGFTVNLSSTFNNQSSSEASFMFLGTEGTLSVGWGELKYWPEHIGEDNRWIVESWPKKLEEAYYKDPKVQKEEMPSLAKAHLVEGGTEWREQGQDATIIHFWHFLNSIKTRKGYWEDAVAGHHAAACAHMVNQSAREGRMVQWDFAKDDVKA
ncbi:Gfo/Idh/MocA family oxidoreductase [uncultured Paludibaculum sp.]|uniref:Gfo/Idh/MocA family protein n=1 Tax=uncultured Paludibaculum sp. TaxID=1765020 RepID=UPI002AAAC983|nr:Gfo/Idh/MocA family oxidoreductase [uncultured Paludibaculum sp.]